MNFILASSKSRGRQRVDARGVLAWLGVVALGSFASCASQGRSAAAATWVAKDPRDLPPPASRSVPQLVHVDLVARERVAELAPGRTYSFWTFNGTVPGPLIRVVEGDTVEVTLHNELTNAEPHNLDFHAAIEPGGGMEASLKPGETKTFSFPATRRRAFIYHCAGEGMPWEHVSHGMYGLIQVDPPGGLQQGYREFYVGQSEWYLKLGAGASDGALFVFDEEAALAENPSNFTFNGHIRALTDPQIYGDAMTVRQGDHVRIFFVNAGPNKTSSFHIVGEIFDKVYSGSPDQFSRNEETVAVPPGSATVIELEAAVPGMYELVDHALFRVPKGAVGQLHVQPAGGETKATWRTDPPTMLVQHERR
jgi:nitrite reductase (NO-forming)